MIELNDICFFPFLRVIQYFYFFLGKTDANSGLFSFIFFFITLMYILFGWYWEAVSFIQSILVFLLVKICADLLSSAKLIKSHR